MKITKKERFETYKKALEICENWKVGTWDLTSPNLCFILPLIKFGYDSYTEVRLKAWFFTETPDYYPEIEPFCKLLDRGEYTKDSIASARIEFLKSLLAK